MSVAGLALLAMTAYDSTSVDTTFGLTNKSLKTFRTEQFEFESLAIVKNSKALFSRIQLII